jgi:hypothetical protein
LKERNKQGGIPIVEKTKTPSYKEIFELLVLSEPKHPEVDAMEENIDNLDIIEEVPKIRKSYYDVSEMYKAGYTLSCKAGKIGKVRAVFGTQKDSNYLKKKGWSPSECLDIYFIKRARGRSAQAITQLPTSVVEANEITKELYVDAKGIRPVGLVMAPNLRRDDVEEFFLYEFELTPTAQKLVSMLEAEKIKSEVLESGIKDIQDIQSVMMQRVKDDLMGIMVNQPKKEDKKEDIK